MGISAVINGLVKVLQYIAEMSAKIIYIWFKKILPICISISFFFYFIMNLSAIGQEIGIILMFLLLSSVFALYVINGKELFTNIIFKLKNMFYL